MTLGWFPPPAEQYLDQIHRTLFPEDWMTEDQVKAGIESGYLNAEGIKEWSGADDLEIIAAYLRDAVRDEVIKPRPSKEKADE